MLRQRVSRLLSYHLDVCACRRSMLRMQCNRDIAVVARRSATTMVQSTKTTRTAAATTNWGNKIDERILQSNNRRNFSDRLLGYSPMSPGTVSPSVSNTGPSKIPTEKDVTTAGGVWAPTSAKRDKLAELKVELKEGQTSLDDAASADESLDLYLAQGLHLVAKTVDGTSLAEKSEDCLRVESWMETQVNRLPADIGQEQWVAHLTDVADKITAILEHQSSSTFLKEIRDFYDPNDVPSEELTRIEGNIHSMDSSFDKTVDRFRLQLAKSAAIKLKDSWQILTTVSDSDVDRAAVQGLSIERQASTLSVEKLHKVLRAYMSDTCANRVDAIWDLMDRDDDGMLDQDEMNEVCYLAIAPVEIALVELFKDALEAYPVRALLLEGHETPIPSGWRQRRKENQAKKNLLKLFQRTIKNHFEDEVEVAHRLRCIYAWSEKSHQDNKPDSVLVDSGWSGRKRYVELQPKIKLNEFREVQSVHFTHLHRVATEILKSFREDLWVQQGKGRQNRELFRDCMLFLTAVSIVDYLILLS